MPNHKNDEALTTCDSQGSLSNKSRVGNIDMNIVAKSDFNFHGVTLNPVENVTGVWLTSADIAKALGYKAPSQFLTSSLSTKMSSLRV